MNSFHPKFGMKTEYESKLRERAAQRHSASMEMVKEELLSKEREMKRLQTVTAEELEILRVETNALKQSQMASLEKQKQLIDGMKTMDFESCFDSEIL